MLAEHPEHPQAGMAELLRKLGATRDDVAYVAGSGARRRRPRAAASRERGDAPGREHGPLAAISRQPTGWRPTAAQLANALAGVRVVVAPTAQDEAEAIALILRSVHRDARQDRRAGHARPGAGAARGGAAQALRPARSTTRPGVPVGAHRARRVPRSRAWRGRDGFRAAGADGAAQASAGAARTAAGRARARRRGRWSAAPSATSMSARGSPARGAALESAHRTRAGKRGRRGSGRPGALAGRARSRARTWKRRSRRWRRFGRIATAKAADAGRGPCRRRPRLWRASANGSSSGSVAGRCRRGAVGAAGRADRREADGLDSGRRRLSAVLSQPRSPARWCARACAAASAPLHLGAARSAPAAARRGDPRLAQRRHLAAGRRARALAQPADARGSSGSPAGAAHRPCRARLRPGARRAPGLSHPRREDRRRADRAVALAAAAAGAARRPALEAKIEPEQPWLGLGARARSRAGVQAACSAPEPRPPLEARPRRLSVTRIERWIANPYEIFARDILKLEKLPALGAEPDAALRGTDRARSCTSRFARIPRQAAGRRRSRADRASPTGISPGSAGSPRVAAFWRPRFQRFAQWFAETEPARRDGVARILTEVEGALDLPAGGGFRLTARADRIDVGDDGAAVIYDYKTGKPPTAEACRQSSTRRSFRSKRPSLKPAGSSGLRQLRSQRPASTSTSRAARRRRGARGDAKIVAVDACRAGAARS